MSQPEHTDGFSDKEKEEFDDVLGALAESSVVDREAPMPADQRACSLQANSASAHGVDVRPQRSP